VWPGAKVGEVGDQRGDLGSALEVAHILEGWWDWPEGF
jgi:hypothetical protein